MKDLSRTFRGDASAVSKIRSRIAPFRVDASLHCSRLTGKLKLRAALGLLAWSIAFYLHAEATANRANFDIIAAQAAQARTSGDTDRAIQMYRRGTALRSSWAEGWWNLGTIYYERKHWQSAADAFRRVTSLNPKQGAAWAFVGLCEFNMGHFAASFKSLNHSGQIGFGNNEELPPIVLYHIALLLSRDGDFERSLDQLALFVSAGNRSQEIVTAIGIASLRMPVLPSQIPESQRDLVQKAGEASYAFQAHQVEEAKKLFAELVSAYPRQPNVHYAYGIYLLESDPQQAYEEFKKEIQITPGHISARLQVAFSYLQQGEPERALALGQAVITVAPEDYRVYLVLGRAYLQLGNTSKAVVALKRSATLEPKDSETHNYLAQAYFTIGNKSAATSEQAEFQRLKREDTRQSNIAGWWYFAGQYYGQRRFPEARDAFRKITEQNPSDGAAWAIMGLCEFELKDYANALQHLREARSLPLQNNPQVEPALHFYLAILLNRDGQFDEALNELSALEHTDADAKTLQASGLNTLRMKLLPAEISPNQNEFITQVGRASWSMNSGKWSDATRQFVVLTSTYPDSPYLHYEYGVCLAQSGKSDDAMREFRRELELNPTNVDALSQTVFIDLKEGSRDRALHTAETAVEMAPNRFLPHNVLGWALLANQQFSRAVEEMSAAARIAPYLAVSRYSLAQAYRAAGRSAEADKEMAEYESLKKQRASGRTPRN
jgi:tetratricopeptide (TPR) repeat protein